MPAQHCISVHRACPAFYQRASCLPTSVPLPQVHQRQQAEAARGLAEQRAGEVPGEEGTAGGEQAVGASAFAATAAEAAVEGAIVGEEDKDDVLTSEGVGDKVCMEEAKIGAQRREAGGRLCA